MPGTKAMKKTKSVTKVKSSSKVKTTKSVGKMGKSNTSIGKTKSITKSAAKLRNDSKSNIKSSDLANQKTSTVLSKSKLPKVQVTAMKSRKMQNRPKSVDSDSFKFIPTSEDSDGQSEGSPKVKINVIHSNCGRPGGPEKTDQLQKSSSNCLKAPSREHENAAADIKCDDASDGNAAKVGEHVDADMQKTAAVQHKTLEHNGEPANNPGPASPETALANEQLVAHSPGWGRLVTLFVVIFAVVAIVVGVILANWDQLVSGFQQKFL